MKNISLFDSKFTELPRERLLKFGSSVLSDAELLSIVMRSSGKDTSLAHLSDYLIKKFGGLKGLQSVDINKLCKVKHVGIAKASAIKAACEIGLRIGLGNNISKKTTITKSQDIYQLLKKTFYSLRKEHLYLISLDSRMCVNSIDLVSIGTLNETLLHPRDVFKTAFDKDAAFIILAHNHPSGNSSPSDADIEMTRQVKHSGDLLGLPLIDHVIVCNHSFTSLRAQGYLGDKSYSMKGGD